jgi:hypothetical protein
MKAKTRKAWERANATLECNVRLVEKRHRLCRALHCFSFHEVWSHWEFASLALDGIDYRELP